ncbi:MAG: SOS response-associated peptidase [Desulfobacterales bacterium]|nr:SOS response-associated peptidase [Desulfobacterales bacterium]
MCGRYVSPDEAAIERAWNVIHAPNPFRTVYNAAPTMDLPVVRLHEGQHEVCAMQWGLIPVWWSKPEPPRSTINARIEEAATKPMWRSCGQAHPLPGAQFRLVRMAGTGSGAGQAAVLHPSPADGAVPLRRAVVVLDAEGRRAGPHLRHPDPRCRGRHRIDPQPHACRVVACMPTGRGSTRQRRTALRRRPSPPMRR